MSGDAERKIVARWPAAATLVAGAAAAALLLATPAGAAIPDSLISAPGAASACSLETAAPGFTYRFCDDGLPPTGGATPNVGGVNAVTVPAKYAGFAGLPARAGDAATVPGADLGGDIALDVDISYPTDNAAAHPLIVLMHGCCAGDKTGWEATSLDAGGEKWHYSNAWFASRGYVVINYTARGFVNGEQNGNRGSTGQTQLDSRSYEINDYQSLACQAAAAFNAGDPRGQSLPDIDPARVVTTGGSYGGGFSWMALTDPDWSCDATPGGPATMKLAAAAPKYGWTDLAYTLVPTGTHFQTPGDLPATNACDSGPRRPDGSDCIAPGDPITPIGTPKTSIVAGLYASGKTGIPPGAAHATFPPSVDEAFQCLNEPYPPDLNPLCANTLDTILPEFLRERSAYYQADFFADLAKAPADLGYQPPVPTFDAATFTDPLFPAYENRRMINRLRAVVPGYPVQAYYGDYQHFVQNKAKEWGDLCGQDHHVCTTADFGNGINSDPGSLVRTGVTTRLNRFIDHYAQPPGNPSQSQPGFDVTASLQVCPQNAAGLGVAANEPGPAFNAATFEQLAPNSLSLDFQGARNTTSKVPGNSHAVNSDPVKNSLGTSQGGNAGRCPVETESAEPGVATYTSEPLSGPATMIGSSTLTINYSATSALGLQFNVRLYDVFPDGTAVMVDRGTRRVTAAEGTAGPVTYQLHGNGWRFPAGHRVRIEIAQDDSPFVRASDAPSSATISSAQLVVPTVEQLDPGGGEPDTTPPTARVNVPALASAESTDPTFKVEWSGDDDSSGIGSFDVQVRRISGNGSDWRSLSNDTQATSLEYQAGPDRTLEFRVRAIDGAGNQGDWALGRVIVPADERAAFEFGPWADRNSQAAWLGGLMICRSRDCGIGFRYRGGDFYLIVRKGPSGGRARITLDGVSRVVSFYSPQTRHRRVLFHQSLNGVGEHRLSVRVLRTANAASSGFDVAIDGFAVEGRKPLAR